MQLTPSPPRPGRDAGFTLIELLVAITILAVIAVPLGNAIIGYLRNSAATTDRLALSHDAQISAAYFARDVAAAGVRDYTVSGAPFVASIQLDAAYNASGRTCGTAATPVAKVRFLSDDWDTSTGTPVVRTAIVAYYLTTTGAVRELHRMKCVASATPVADVIIAHFVDPSTLTVACTSPTACDTAAVPQKVTLAFAVTTPSVGAYPISLTGQRRQT
jgi:prepilin-type N-terminal cleavage/methylation domain-containing protein